MIAKSAEINHAGFMASNFDPSQTNLTGKCLIATPVLNDPRFFRTVIFLNAHGSDGAMGIILNRPEPLLSFAALCKDMSVTPPEDGKVLIHFGGPVDAQRGFVLHSRDGRVYDATAGVTDEIALTASPDIIADLGHETGPKHALFALGYAGWAPGQLESELRDNSWLVADVPSSLVFDADADEKWQRFLGFLGIDPVMLSSTGGSA